MKKAREIHFSGANWEGAALPESKWPVHGHLGFKTNNIHGHYIVPVKEGFIISLFLDLEGEREEAGQRLISLTKKEKCVLANTPAYIEEESWGLDHEGDLVPQDRETCLGEIWF